MEKVSLAEAIGKIRSEQSVFVHGGSATPRALLAELWKQSSRLVDVELIHLHTLEAVPTIDAGFRKSFKVTHLFVGANWRPHLDYDRIDYLPCFLSEIPNLFRSGIKPIDVALLHLSPPDEQGYCSLGTSVDVARAAFDAAKVVIAQINPKMPNVQGDGQIHQSEIDYWVEINESLPEAKTAELSEIEKKIGHHAASIIENGSCLQVGIGAVPDSVLAALSGHRHLGIHTELWSDGVLNLIRAGAVDNSKKVVHPGKTVSTFIMGSQNVYDYIGNNPSVICLGADYVNNPIVIASNPQVAAINSAVEIDLTGQICADSVGHRVISGVGGQMDFMRGAALSAGGKPIIVLSARTKRGESRIVSALKPGAGVVTTRAHVHWVVTEYGKVNLQGMSLHERAKALIQLSHPEDREKLEREWSNIHRG